MRKKTIMVVSVVILIIFGLTMVLSVLPAFAAPTAQQLLQEAQQKREQQQKKVQQAQQEAETNKNKNEGLKENALELKKASDEKLIQIQSEQTQIQQQLQAIDQNISVLTNEYNQAVEKANLQEEGMKKRLRAMQEGSLSGYLEILFSSKSLSDLFVRLNMLRDIMEYDNKVLVGLNTISADLEEKKTKVEAERTNKEAEELRLMANKQQVSNVIQEQDALINSIKLKETQDAKKVAQEEAILKKLEEEIDRLDAQILNQVQQQQSKTNYGGGQLGWPVPSCRLVTSEFGYRIHPIFGTRKLHAGMDIGAPANSVVVAAEAGKVLFAGYSSSYGNYVTIDHGGIVTLYAHNNSLMVSTGQQVTRGQQIALSGSTGVSTGAHVHFEVIKNGVHQNPRDYL